VISVWWEILKNAKVSGKATGKGSSFDASKIKINIDEPDDCCDEVYNKLVKFINRNDVVAYAFPNVYMVSDFTRESLDGLGHKFYLKYQPLPPLNRKATCKDGVFLYIQLRRIHHDCSDTLKSDAYPFSSEQYRNAKKSFEESIKEWKMLKNTFSREFNTLWDDIMKCDDFKRELYRTPI